jgi:hypothetical protein
VNLSDLSNSPYLASDDYKVGTIFPLLTIEAIRMEDVPAPGTTKKTAKAIMLFAGAKKGWCVNKTEARKIAKALGEDKNIERTWIGAKVALEVVGDVRRPDGTRGNAFRIHEVKPKDAMPPTVPAVPVNA